MNRREATPQERLIDYQAGIILLSQAFPRLEYQAFLTRHAYADFSSRCRAAALKRTSGIGELLVQFIYSDPDQYPFLDKHSVEWIGFNYDYVSQGEQMQLAFKDIILSSECGEPQLDERYIDHDHITLNFGDINWALINNIYQEQVDTEH